MALVLADRVKETTTTTGTATYTLAGASTGFESFASIGDGNTTYYACTDGTDFEVGIGTYTASGTTLARTTILQSSNSDAAVSWSSGTKTIFCCQPAEKAVFLDASGNIAAFNGSNLTNVDASQLDSQAPAYYLNYNNFTNTPTIPTNNNELSNGAGYITSADGGNAQTLDSLDSTQFLRSDAADTMSANLTIADDTSLYIGTGGDLEIHYNSSNGNSRIRESGSGGLYIDATNLYLRGSSPNFETYAQFIENGAVELYYDNSKKFETTSTGATVTGDLTLTSTDAGATTDPSLVLFRDSASPTAGDSIGSLGFHGNSSTDTERQYAFTRGSIVGATDGNEYGQLRMGVIKAGSISTAININAANNETRFQNFPVELDDVDLTIVSTDAGATENPSLILHRDSASPADFDVIGNIQFDAENSAGEQITYGNIKAQIVDQTDGTEDGYLRFTTIIGGGEQDHLRLGFSTADFYGNVRINPNAIVSDPALIFEGTTDNDFETFVKATDPTADRTISLPDATGTLPVFTTAPTGAIADGTNGQVLTTDGSGGLSFTTVSGGGGGSGGTGVAFTLYEYTATAGQTTFSGSDDNTATLAYTVDLIQVVVNGVILDPSDYTATNGTSIVLSTGATLNDVVNIYAYSGGVGYFQGENGDRGDTTNGKGDIFRTHEQVLNTNTTIATGDNSGCFFSLEVATGVTLTVNGNLVIA